jgi:hypothetical protein
MAVVTIAVAVDLTLLTMKWREQYVSEGLNRKLIPGTPRGIYRGLRLEFDGTQGGGERKVAVSAGSESTHEAVYQNTTGHALTYIDNAGTSVILDLSDGDLDGVDAVIAMFVDYQIGADTSAEWRAYPVADYDALPAAEKDELVILGTVKNLAAATNVVASDIYVERRTVAWENNSAGGRQWETLLKGPGFEVGEVGTGRFSIAHWVADTTGGTGLWDLSGDVRTGETGLRVSSTSGATFVSELRHDVGLYVDPTQMIRYRVLKKVQTITTGGDVFLRFGFTSRTLGAPSGTHDISIPTGVTNPDFVEVSGLFTPEEAAITSDSVLTSVSLVMTGVDASTTVDFDGVQVWAEQYDAIDPANLTSRAGGVSYLNSLYLMDRAATFGAASSGVIVEYDSGTNNIVITNPSNVGQDGTLGTANEEPDLQVRAAVDVGSSRLGSLAGADMARVIAPASVFAGVEYTLMWESIPTGTHGYRQYVGSDGAIVETINAFWNNTTDVWQHDDTGSDALKTIKGITGMAVQRRTTTAGTWTDGQWDVDRAAFGGSSNTIDINMDGPGDAINIDMQGSDGAGQAIVITEASKARTSELVHITGNSTGAGTIFEVTKADGTGILCFLDNNEATSAGHCLRIDNASTSSSADCIEINHSGKGVGIDLNITGAPGVPGLDITYNGTQDALVIAHTGTSGNCIQVSNSNSSSQCVFIDNNDTSAVGIELDQAGSGDAFNIDQTGTGICLDLNVSGTGSSDVIDIASSRTGGNAIDVNATSMTSGNLFQFTGQGSSLMELIRYGRLRLTSGLSVNTGAMSQYLHEYASFASSMTQYTITRAGTSAYNFMQFYANNGSDPSWRVNGLGQMFADVGTVGTPADYAEYVAMETDASNYDPGDVLVFSGEDGTFDKTTTPSSNQVAGVYSTNPFLLGNAAPGCSDYQCDIASGTLEANAWHLDPNNGDVEETQFNRIVIDGDQTANYAVDTHAQFNNKAIFKILSSVYDGPGDETTVVVDHDFPTALDNPAVPLYYGLAPRNVVPMAMLGQVPTNCITENGTINAGDMLVTSSTAGYAMKAGGSPSIGTIIGKSMETLNDTGAGDDVRSMMVYVNLS